MASKEGEYGGLAAPLTEHLQYYGMGQGTAVARSACLPEADAPATLYHVEQFCDRDKCRWSIQPQADKLTTTANQGRKRAKKKVPETQIDRSITRWQLQIA